ncbi:putative signal transduction histidine kinase domain protein [Orientia chuto str. Dubai]|uniref:Putative signal transduction histidine kinase domain protein n=1 Tax=Orientia chuto str. Dubai TaxID=1359168 RepID=A0A0F3MJT5_9RICK|nr:putative signal transduction histidine kinase domain protein [Orientia chuto str. Dubai]
MEKAFNIEMQIIQSAMNTMARYEGIKLSCDYLSTIKEVIGDNYRIQIVLTI